jgi:hypothetical protein
MPLTTTQYLPEVALTIPQRRWLDWADGAMRDFWLDADERALEGETTCDHPIILTTRGALVAARRGVLEDLKYRLTEQVPDMTDDLSPLAAATAVRSAENAWLAVERVAEANGFANVEGK